MYHELTERQDGLATYRQLREAGLTRSDIESLVRRRVLERERRGVLRVAGAPRAPDVPIRATLLAAGAFTTAARRSAARLTGLSGFVERQPEIISWGRKHPRLDGVIVHHARRMPSQHLTIVRGIQTTTAARTLVDLSPELSFDRLQRTLAHARRADLLRLTDVVAAAEGRRNMQTLAAVLAKEMEGDTDSDFEAFVYWTLAEAGLPLPVQQFQAVVPEGVYLLDHAYPPPLMIDLEIKGFGHAQDRVVFDRDSFRRVHLRRAGWLGMEITTAWTERDIVDETRAILLERGWQGAA